jgi:hypothetical protein
MNGIRGEAKILRGYAYRLSISIAAGRTGEHQDQHGERQSQSGEGMSNLHERHSYRLPAAGASLTGSPRFRHGRFRTGS